MNDLINEALVPFQFTRPIRSFNVCERWKCDEFKNFILYLTGPYLQTLQPSDYFISFMFYARAYKITKMDCIHKGVTYQIDILMKIFYSGLSVYNDESICTLKVHTTSAHAGEPFRDYGLLDEASSKLFENLNGILAKRSNRTNDIDDQLIGNFNYLRYSNQMASTLEDINGNILSKDSDYYKQLLEIGLRDDIKLNGLKRNWVGEEPQFDKEFAYCHSSSNKFADDPELASKLNTYEETEEDGLFVQKIKLHGTQFRVKSTDTENRSNSYILYENGRRKLGRVHALYRTKNKHWRALVHYYDNYNAQEVYPSAHLPLTDTFEIVSIANMIDICVVVRASSCIFMIPVKHDYILLRPIEGWREKYENEYPTTNYSK